MKTEKKIKMNIKIIKILISIGLIILVFLNFGRLNHSIKPKDAQSEIIKAQAVEPGHNPLRSNQQNTQPDKKEKVDTNHQIDRPMISGPVTKVPWINDAEFILAQDQNDTPILMAAYCAVLKDPLPGEEYNVHLAARMLAGKVICPGDIFSQNQQIGPYTTEKGFQKGPTYIGSQLATTIGGGVCKIASTLYNVVILSDLQVIQRSNHSMPVPYVPYGQDATVSYGSRDLRFKNNKTHSVMIWAKEVENQLYIGFYGAEKPPRIEWHHETIQTTKAPIIEKIVPGLAPGTSKTILEGMDGAIIKSWLTIEQQDGKIIIKNLGLSHYRPLPFLIEKSEH